MNSNEFLNFSRKWDSVDSGSGSTVLASQRLAFREELVGRVYPSRKDEEWKYTNVLSLSRISFDDAEKIGASASSISDLEDVYGRLSDDDQTYVNLLQADSRFFNFIFIDGTTYASPCKSTLADYGLEVLTLAEAYESEDLSSLDKELDGKFDSVFSLLNGSMIRDGIFIKALKSREIDRPLRIVHLSTTSREKAVNDGAVANDDTSVTVQPRLIIKMEENSKLDVLQHFSTNSDAFYNVVSNVKLAPGAKLNHTKVVSESTESTHISTDRVSIDRSAVFNSMNLSIGGKLVRQDLNVYLNGEGAEAHLNGVYVGVESRHIDNHLNVFHAKPHTVSSQLYKGVMGGSSRGVFNGKIIIEKDAQKSDAKQLNKNLLVSDKAEVDTKPELWVSADDVKAAHGATVGQLSEDEIFYLQTRGINREIGKQILSKAFLQEVLYKISHDEIKNEVTNKFNSIFDRNFR